MKVVKNFDLNLLRALDALLRERNVTRAADQLFVTQQAMSGSLKRLREHFDDPILTPVGRKLQLTALGRSLVTPVRDALLSANFALETQPRFDPATARQKFQIAISDYATLVIMPTFLKRLSQEAPNIICDIRTIREWSLERIFQGEIDLCITAADISVFRSSAPLTNIRQELFFQDDFVCAVDSRNTEIKSALDIQTYCQTGQVATRLGGGLQTVVDRTWAEHGLSIRIVARAPTFSSLLFMLPGTPYIATAQRRLVNALSPGLGLRLLECPVPIAKLQETLVWHSRNDRSAAHRYIRDMLKDVGAKLKTQA